MQHQVQLHVSQVLKVGALSCRYLLPEQLRPVIIVTERDEGTGQLITREVGLDSDFVASSTIPVVSTTGDLPLQVQM